MQKDLGKGQFGQVSKAMMKNILPGKAESAVAVKMLKGRVYMHVYIYCIGEIFVGLNFVSGLANVFLCLIFVLRPEHIITVAYCLLLLQCPDFRGLIFRFWALCNENINFLL